MCLPPPPRLRPGSETQKKPRQNRVKVIISCWLLALLFASLYAVLEIHEQVARLYRMASYDVVTLLIVAISYAIIIFKVKSNPPPQPFGSLASERKLSVTLFSYCSCLYTDHSALGYFVLLFHSSYLSTL